MTEDTGQGRNGYDMPIEPVEPIPDTGDGEPFWVEHRTEEGLKTHHMRMVRVEDDSMEPGLREGDRSWSTSRAGALRREESS